MRVFLAAQTPLTLQSFQSVLRELAARGHEVVVGVHEDRSLEWGADMLAELRSDAPGLRIETAPTPRDPWLELGADVRSSIDLFQFLGPRFNDTYRARSWRRAPKLAQAVARNRLGRTRPVRTLFARLLRAVERVLPTNGEIERYLASKRPDVVLLTPYLGLRTIQPDFLRAAQALGLRTGICVKSWDNLSSKSILRPIPDRVFVWNEIQRGEAETLHGVPPERVAVTGAQSFDEWFHWQPRPREEFLDRVGLDPERPYVLYTCCAPWTRQTEVEFVRRWVQSFRSSGDETLATTNVLVRPHPKRPQEWVDAELGDLPGVVVFPEDAHAPVDRASKADYFDSLHHSAAVFGLNTSAMIEAAVVGRPVLTVLDPEFDKVQLGTLHFRYLLEVGGGAVRVAHTHAEHAEQLGRAIRGEDDSAERARAFVQAFVRPHGLDVDATGVFVDEIERLADGAPAAIRRPGPAGRVAQRLLRPVAARAARAS